MDATLKFSIIRKLKDNYADLTPGLKRVAKYIIDNPADFGLDPVRTTARKTGVSTFTLVRLAKALNFERFEDLRHPFRQALVAVSEGGEGPDWTTDRFPTSGTYQDQAEATRNTMAIVSRSLRLLDPAQAERTIAAMFSANTVYVTAVRASYAVALYLDYVGRMALPSLRLVPHNMNSAVDELTTAGPDDLLIAITFAPYSKETIEACRYAKSKGLKLILISDSDVVMPELNPTEVLVAATHSTHYFGCYTGAMAIVENLIALMVRKGGSAAAQRIKDYEDLREEFSAYWKQPK